MTTIDTAVIMNICQKLEAVVAVAALTQITIGKRTACEEIVVVEAMMVEFVYGPDHQTNLMIGREARAGAGAPIAEPTVQNTAASGVEAGALKLPMQSMRATA
jgi:hypothetical protein